MSQNQGKFKDVSIGSGNNNAGYEVFGGTKTIAAHGLASRTTTSHGKI
jgi:hypothetical protein